MDISEVDVEKYIGTPSAESEKVPTVDPDEKCRGKRVVGPPDDKRFEGYCKNVAGKGTEHLHEGRCKRHGGADGAGGQEGNQNALDNDGGAPPDNDNRVTHAAFASGFDDRLNDREREARQEIKADYIDGDGEKTLVEIQSDLALKFQRSGDPRFVRRIEKVHELLHGDDEDANQHAHLHQHLGEGDHELTDQQRADIQAMFASRRSTSTGTDTDTDTNSGDAETAETVEAEVIDTDTDTDTDTDADDTATQHRGQDHTLDVEVDETVSTAAPGGDPGPDASDSGSDSDPNSDSRPDSDSDSEPRFNW